jgi:hypothetical protein
MGITGLENMKRRKIRLIESNAKCRNLKSDLDRHFAAGVYLSEAPSPPVRHVTGTGSGLLGEIPRAVVQKSALL